MSNNLIVAYQLQQPAQHDHTVQATIKSLGAWAYFETWVFYLKTQLSPIDVRDRVWSVMNSGDKLFVGEMSSAAWQGLTKECSDFVYQHWAK